jgi:hypothetical protein
MERFPRILVSCLLPWVIECSKSRYPNVTEVSHGNAMFLLSSSLLSLVRKPDFSGSTATRQCVSLRFEYAQSLVSQVWVAERPPSSRSTTGRSSARTAKFAAKSKGGPHQKPLRFARKTAYKTRRGLTKGWQKRRSADLPFVWAALRRRTTASLTVASSKPNPPALCPSLLPRSRLSDLAIHLIKLLVSYYGFGRD